MKSKSNVSFKPVSINPKILSIFGGIGFVQLAGAFLGFLLNAIIARNLSLSDFSIYSSVFNLVNLFSALISFGLGPLWLKLLVDKQGKKDTYMWVSPSIAFFCITTCISVTFYMLYINYFGESTEYRMLGYAMLFAVLSQSLIPVLSSFLQFHDQVVYASSLNAYNFLVRILFVTAAFIFISDNLKSLSVAFFLSGITLLYLFLRKLSMFLKKLKKQSVNIQGSKVSVINIVRQAAPFGLISVFYSIYYQGNIIILQAKGLEEEIAFYNVSFTLISLILLLPNAIFTFYFLPKLHSWSGNNETKLSQFLKTGSKFMLLIGLVVSVVSYGCGYFMFSIFFGEKYIAGLPIYYILLISIPFRFLFTVSDYVMMTGNRVVKKLQVQAAAAFLSIALNFLFIDYYGVLGAAYTTVILEILLSIYMLKAATKSFKHKA